MLAFANEKEFLCEGPFWGRKIFHVGSVLYLVFHWKYLASFGRNSVLIPSAAIVKFFFTAECFFEILQNRIRWFYFIDVDEKFQRKWRKNVMNFIASLQLIFSANICVFVSMDRKRGPNMMGTF